MANGAAVTGAQNQQPAAPSNEEVALAFRQSLDDTIAILETVGPICTDIDELIQMLSLARKNDSQLHLIMHQVMPTRLRR